MPIISPKFTISRQQASEILAVSTRTLDRYIRSKKLSARKKGGNILLSEEEIQNLKVAHFQNMHGASPETTDRAHRHVDSVSQRQAKIFDAETGEVEENPVAVVAEKSSTGKSERENVFEELYDLSRRELREIHNKLEATSYKLGQAETQMKHSVPLLEYQAKEEAIREQEALIENKIKRQEETLEVLEVELKGERFNKNIYIGLLFGLLALQPLLWLFLQS